MRSYALGLFFISVIGLTACSKEEDHYVSPSLIPLETSIQLNTSGNALLSLDEVVSDSRCPANALCTWAGIAIAKFTFTADQQSHPFMLSIMPGFPKQDTLINGYRIEFSDLKPYPGLTTDHLPKTSIQAEIRITRL